MFGCIELKPPGFSKGGKTFARAGFCCHRQSLFHGCNSILYHFDNNGVKLLTEPRVGLFCCL